jgi:GNAT superfamily N-acetyltransferase
MIQQLVYPESQLPAHLRWQILSFLRIEWPDGFVGQNRLRDWISREEQNPLSFVLVENDILISHAQVLWKYLGHAGETYNVYGLSGVFTYPAFRKQGYGRQVVALATAYIDASDADVGIVHTRAPTKEFYSKNGWIPMEKAVTLVGSEQSPVVSDQFMLMRFVSEKGKRGRASFEGIPLYFGEDIW